MFSLLFLCPMCWYVYYLFICFLLDVGTMSVLLLFVPCVFVCLSVCLSVFDGCIYYVCAFVFCALSFCMLLLVLLIFL